MNVDEEYIKDIIAVDIYGLILQSGANLPLESRYIVVEFSEDGRVKEIRLSEEEEEGARVITANVENVKEGRKLLERIRDALDIAELDMDMRHWELVADAYDWIWHGGENAE